MMNTQGPVKQLQYRMTDLPEPRCKFVKIFADAKFPLTLSYDNPLVGILHHKRDTSFNFIMKSGD